MKFGFQCMNTPDDLAPDVLAKTLEERGFDSLWVGEHSHIPASRDTPYPTGGPLPPKYFEMMDPFVSLALAASATKTLLLGTGVTLPLEHHVLELAKAVASLDHFSGGRVAFGVGVGWNVEELANYSSVPWPQRYRAVAERVAALKVLWTDIEPQFHGEFVDFEPVHSNPKPTRIPPIFCGMAGRLGTRHTIEYADAWMPLDTALGNVGKKIKLFREATEAAGRAPIPISMVVMGDPSFELLRSYADLGVERLIIGLEAWGWLDSSNTLKFIDAYASMLPDLQ